MLCTVFHVQTVWKTQSLGQCVSYYQARGPGETSRSPKEERYTKEMGRIINSVGKQADQVRVDITSEEGSAQLTAVVDTGSDWCCAWPKEILKLNEHPINPYPPTFGMESTTNVSCVKMTPIGFIPVKIAFGD